MKPSPSALIDHAFLRRLDRLQLISRRGYGMVRGRGQAQSAVWLFDRVCRLPQLQPRRRLSPYRLERLWPLKSPLH